MRVQCLANDGTFLCNISNNKAFCLVRRHLAEIAEADSVLRDCIIAVKLNKGVPFEELKEKKNWRFAK